MKELKKAIVLFIIFAFSGICIYVVTESFLKKHQEKFDISFTNKIEISIDGQKFTFTDKKDIDYIRTFIEGKPYKNNERIEACFSIYHFDYLKLIGKFGIKKLTLTPTGDDCGFYVVYGIFAKNRFDLRTHDLYPLMEFFESKTNLKIIDEQFRE